MGCINEITGTTILTGLLGSPVTHSKSPLMHNEAYRLLELDYVYLCFDVNEDNLAVAFDGLKQIGFKGLNCTMPNKTLMCSLVDELSPAAKIIGAVNTVVNEDGHYVGHNTDGVGYVKSLADDGFDICGKNVTLLGSGGAASSICVQSALDGAKSINIFSRNDCYFDNAVRLTKDINQSTDCKATLFELGDNDTLGSSIADSDILINATPVGMAPNIDNCIIPNTDMLRPSLLVSDIIYNPLETKLMKMAKSIGCKTHNGLYMLLYQGAESFKLWTGKEMPVDRIKGLITK